MPITMTQHAPGMPPHAYDEIMVGAGEPLRRSPGFVSHVAHASSDGITVTEVWESREQWEQWYTTSVKPHLPPDAPPPVVSELHNALGR
ncbi:MAG: antibiotic biosynthesis monooxygenase [Solirubrobacterales bacterium]|nr:antibiotic biosynthesis monooxygenase [Solirubrobacterales bacterium]